jgi:nucleoside-diphosphate kinase
MGACIALEVKSQNVIEKFRSVCGPYDPEISRTIRKESIRAKYGVSIAQNAIHCTDLEEDGELEVIFILF